MDQPLRKIVGFFQDHEDHWVADLECGHTRHVRHQPPWQERPWVESAETREQYIGQQLGCRQCADDTQG